jgi:hypothetical protein
MNQKPALIRIIQSDYVAMLGALTPAVFLAAYIAVAYFGFLPGFRGRDPIQGTDGAPFFLYGFLITLALGVPAVIWRYTFFKNLFASGTAVPGKVESVQFWRDRGNVVYRYEYQGKAYSGANAVMRNARTRALTPGTDITLIVDQDDPRRALIRDLYL